MPTDLPEVSAAVARLYDQLRNLARLQLAREGADPTLHAIGIGLAHDSRTKRTFHSPTTGG